MQKARTPETVINVDLNELTGEMLLSEIIDSITLLPLETSDDCLLGNVKNVIALDSIFVVLDNRSNAVFTFSRTGQFITQIGCCGEGPGNYVDASQIDVETSTGDILVYDRIGAKVITYDQSGRYKSHKLTIGGAFDFAYTECNGNKSYWFVDNQSDKEHSGIIRHDLKTEKVIQVLPRATEFRSNIPYEFIHVDEKTYVAAPPFENDVYELSCDSLSLSVALNVEPLPDKADVENERSKQFMTSFQRTGMSITSQWLHLFFWSTNGTRAVRIDRSTGDVRVSQSIKYGFDEPQILEAFPRCYDDVEINLAAPRKPDDNPMLAFLHYKKTVK